jgi:2-(1,2-epoxy-1,2-dihydrophenyl)acetyl-CoA isomerase
MTPTPDPESRYLSFDGGVLTAVIATADSGGSLCEPGLAALRSALQRSRRDPAGGAGDRGGDEGSEDGAIRAVLLVSENKNFCTGGNIAAFAAADDPAVEVRRQAEALHACLEVMAAAPVVVVAAVPGWAAGAGMSLVCQCDLVVAGESTRLRPGYPSLGFSPDGGLTWTLPRIVGTGRAREILYTDRVVEAREALALGLVHRVVGDGEIRTAATDLARQIASGPTGAYGRIKGLLAGSPVHNMARQLADEADAVSFGAGTAEGREGVAAFLQRRPARFG